MADWKILSNSNIHWTSITMVYGYYGLTIILFFFLFLSYESVTTNAFHISICNSFLSQCCHILLISTFWDNSEARSSFVAVVLHPWFPALFATQRECTNSMLWKLWYVMWSLVYTAHVRKNNNRKIFPGFFTLLYGTFFINMSTMNPAVVAVCFFADKNVVMLQLCQRPTI